MADKKACPECHKKNTYVLISGYIVCRDCGYDGRKIKGIQKEHKK